MIVTKGAAEGTAGNAVSGQLIATPRALYASAALIAGMGVLPGFPLGIFLPLAALLVTIALNRSRRPSA
nr:FHIPEP family type III secretion protein [Paracoccus sp. Z118]